MRRTGGQLLPAATVLVLVLAACQGGTPSGNASGGQPSDELMEGGTLTVGIGAYPSSFNPNQARSAPGYTMHRATFDTLVKADPSNGDLSPGLALSWKPLDDTTWQFALRQGVKWHDGTPFTADDVVATVDLTLNGKPPAQYASRISDAVKAEKVDTYTVNIITKQRSAILPIGLADIYIYQAKQIQEGGNDAINANPIGTGPFKMDSKVEGVSVTLVRNDDYWGPKPSIDKVVFKAIPEDETRVAALETGEIDIAYNVPPDDGPRLEADKQLGIQWTPIGQSMMVQFALQSPEIPSDSPLQNPTVRQALNYAVDKESLISNLLGGYSKPLQGQLIGSDGAGFNPDISSFSYDPDKAKDMLAQAGYPDGFAMTLTTGEGRYVKQVEIPQAIAGQLAKVGVTAKIDQRQWADVITTAGKKGLASYYIGWNYFPVQDGDFVLQHFACPSIYGLMCDSEYDSLFQQERSTTDPEQRVKIMQKMEQILHDNAPAIFLFQAPDIFGVNARVHGFTPTADDMIHLETISLSGGN